MRHPSTIGILLGGLALALLMQTSTAIAQNGPSAKAQPSARAQSVIDHWTPDRIASAIPRDLVFDENGLPFIRGENGEWKGKGHTQPFSRGAQQDRRGRPTGFNRADTQYPVIDGDTIGLDEWSLGGDVQTAAGRLLYELPIRRNLSRWGGYVCSGTAVTDNVSGRSIILTAGHCVYDDAYGVFARNVLFIPNQAETSGSETDTNCSNDPIGCWVAEFGVTDSRWATASFPYDWDFGYYVVPDTGSYAGSGASSSALDQSVRTLPMSFSPARINDGATGSGTPDFTYALGYPGNLDPNFMHCAEDATTINSQLWLPSCRLWRGASGGPWVQPMTLGTGSGTIISVNSYGFGDCFGMAGPRLSGSASCVFDVAKSIRFNEVLQQDGRQGVLVDGC